MIDSSEKRKRQLAFELQNSCVFEKRSNKFASQLPWVALLHASYYEDSDRGQTVTAKKPD